MNIFVEVAKLRLQFVNILLAKYALLARAAPKEVREVLSEVSSDLDELKNMIADEIS